jgi:hypothetical protein
MLASVFYMGSALSAIDTSLDISPPSDQAASLAPSSKSFSDDIGNAFVGFVNERAELEIYLWFIDGLYKRHCMDTEQNGNDRLVLANFCAISDIYTYSYSHRLSPNELRDALKKDSKMIFTHYAVNLVSEDFAYDLGQLLATVYIFNDIDQAIDSSLSKAGFILDIARYAKERRDMLGDKLRRDCSAAKDYAGICKNLPLKELLGGFDNTYSRAEELLAEYTRIRSYSKTRQQDLEARVKQIKHDIEQRIAELKTRYRIDELKKTLDKIATINSDDDRRQAFELFNRYLVDVLDEDRLERYFNVLKALQYAHLNQHRRAVVELSRSASHLFINAHGEKVDYDDLDPWRQQSVRLLNVLTFASRLAETRSGEEIRQIINDYAAPAGTWRAKLDNPSHWTLTSFFGVSASREFVVDNDRDRFASIKGYAPLGLDLTWPVKVYRKNRNKEWYLSHRNSSGVYIQLLDFGKLLSIDISESDSRVENTDSSGSYLSPGIFYRRSFKESPFVWGVGATYTPSSWEIDGQEVNTWSLKMFLAVDVTLLNF